jgi:hypothetical protein
MILAPVSAPAAEIVGTQVPESFNSLNVNKSYGPGHTSDDTARAAVEGLSGALGL